MLVNSPGLNNERRGSVGTSECISDGCVFAEVNMYGFNAGRWRGRVHVCAWPVMLPLHSPGLMIHPCSITSGKSAFFCLSSTRKKGWGEKKHEEEKSQQAKEMEPVNSDYT